MKHGLKQEIKRGLSILMAVNMVAGSALPVLAEDITEVQTEALVEETAEIAEEETVEEVVEISEEAAEEAVEEEIVVGEVEETVVEDAADYSQNIGGVHKHQYQIDAKYIDTITGNLDLEQFQMDGDVDAYVKSAMVSVVLKCAVCDKEPETMGELIHGVWKAYKKGLYVQVEEEVAPDCAKETAGYRVIGIYSESDELGHEYTPDELLKTVTLTIPWSHAYGQSNPSESKGKIYKAPTCTAEGSYTSTCINCHKQFTDVIPALGHSYRLPRDHYEAYKNAALLWNEDYSKASVIAECERCHAATTPIDVSDYICSKVIENATCESDGKTEYWVELEAGKLANVNGWLDHDNTFIKAKVQALGHNLTKVRIVLNEMYKGTIREDILTAIAPAFTFKYGKLSFDPRKIQQKYYTLSEVDKNLDKELFDCYYTCANEKGEQKLENKEGMKTLYADWENRYIELENDPVQPVTCEADGIVNLYVKVKLNNKEYTSQKYPIVVKTTGKEHVWELQHTITPATCRTDNDTKGEGRGVYKCAVCGADDTHEIDRIPHEFELSDKYMTGQDPSCKANGYFEGTCKNCGLKASFIKNDNEASDDEKQEVKDQCEDKGSQRHQWVVSHPFFVYDAEKEGGYATAEFRCLEDKTCEAGGVFHDETTWQFTTNVKVKIVKPATIDEAGVKRYVATFEFTDNLNKPQSIEVESDDMVILPVGLEYAAPEYDWATNYKTCTVTVKAVAGDPTGKYTKSTVAKAVVEVGENTTTYSVSGVIEGTDLHYADSKTVEKKESDLVLADVKEAYTANTHVVKATSSNRAQSDIKITYYWDAEATKKINGGAPIECGTYYAVAEVNGNEEFKAAKTAPAKIKITKIDNNVKVTPVKKTVKAGKTDKKVNITVTQKNKRQQAGKVTYSIKSNKYVTVNAKGVVTVKANAKAGKYVVKVKVAATTNLKKATKEVVITVK